MINTFVNVEGLVTRLVIQQYFVLSTCATNLFQSIGSNLEDRACALEVNENLQYNHISLALQCPDIHAPVFLDLLVLVVLDRPL